MKKQLSSLELHFLLNEINILKNSRIDKIYQPEKYTFIFKFYKASLGKIVLRVDIGQSLFITKQKEGCDETLGFGMFLRKHIGNFFLNNIEQIKPERILKLEFMAKDEIKIMYLEFFGKGNLILCREDDIIIDSLEHHKFRDRDICPNVKYTHPVMRWNIFEINKPCLIELLKNSSKSALVTCLAVDLGLGGVYSEEVCALSKIDKNKNPKSVGEEEYKLITDSIKYIISAKHAPCVIYKNDIVVDCAPFELEVYKEYRKDKPHSISESLEIFYSKTNEAKESEFDKKINTIKKIIEEQKSTIEELKKEECVMRCYGEEIYNKYELVNDILIRMKKATKKYNLKEKLINHKIIKCVDEARKCIVIEI